MAQLFNGRAMRLVMNRRAFDSSQLVTFANIKAKEPRVASLAACDSHRFAFEPNAVNRLRIPICRPFRPLLIDCPLEPVAHAHRLGYAGPVRASSRAERCFTALLVEQIAERLKSGELRNPKIYEFNPDAVYDSKRHCKKNCDQTLRTKNQARRANHQDQVQTGIPPPGKKTSRKKA